MLSITVNTYLKINTYIKPKQQNIAYTDVTNVIFKAIFKRFSSLLLECSQEIYGCRTISDCPATFRVDFI